MSENMNLPFNVIEGGWQAENDKAHCLCGGHVGTARDYFKKHKTNIAFLNIDKIATKEDEDCQ